MDNKEKIEQADKKQPNQETVKVEKLKQSISDKKKNIDKLVQK